ncbi:MAG: mechanosensitive ion channel [Chitinivibrionales bacterium]|nr:mechanosensitive ion channel [Chitinivibrionales bacterium]
MKIREWLSDTTSIDVNSLQSLLVASGIVVAAVVCGLLLNSIVSFILRKIDKHFEPDKTNILLDTGRWRAPLNLLIPALVVALILPAIADKGSIRQIIRHALSIWIISALAFLGARIVGALRDMLLEKYDLSVRDNLKARTVYTQMRVIERILVFAIILLSIASILMTFDKVRQVGVSLLASAGIAGIILGFAAQRSIATIIAGVQIAITQPIRLDDVVIVEKEWGRIEEITLTYVVVRIWDLRRLILPITYFIEKPFQNWTRISADILGTVYIYTDYTVSVDVLREEFKRILKNHPLWDGKVCVMQVTNASEKSMEVRALLSTEDSSKGWELRCHVREKLIEFLQREYPASLPRVRLEIDKEESRNEAT